MAKQQLKSLIHKAPSVIRAKETLAKENSVSLRGVTGSLKSFLLIDFLESFSTRVVYLGCDTEETEQIKEDLELFIGEERVAYFPAHEIRYHGWFTSHTTSKSSRVSTLERLLEKKAPVLVTEASAFTINLPSPSDYLKSKLLLRVGDHVEFEKIIDRLLEFGYRREEFVEQPGEMSVRGGIVDVFPHSCNYPIRIEFWGDTIESLREFDPYTQRSTRSIEKITLYPQEIIKNEERSGGFNLLDYIGQDCLIVVDEPPLIKKNFLSKLLFYEDDLNGQYEDRWRLFEQKLNNFPKINFISFHDQEIKDKVFDLHCKNQDTFRGNLKLFRNFIKEVNHKKLGNHQEPPYIYFLCENEFQAERISDIFLDEEIQAPRLIIAPFSLHRGFIFPEANLIVFTDHQFYGRRKRLKIPRKFSHGLSPRDLKSIKIGDYVVHVDYGIGIFKGLKKISVSGHERECLRLEYRDGDKVYVPLEWMGRVQKYSSREGHKPTVNKLGSPEWQKLKARTKKKLKDMADELIKIYAQRKAKPGHAFSKDTLWQKELEASFPFEDTPDQIKTTLEVKKDMESPRPMDRLVCGDVGFGKTEVAVRAAFKAVMSGKQVAMLVPTTVLAYQHYSTFKDRLDRFSVNVEMLSRFRTKAEQIKILEGLKNGRIDIVIGTHRLLSEDVSFKDLGLVIIDEEQRFGVRHKEKLKRFKATIDVLTLTATPIPRTLYLSLMGAKDVSYINTPPRNRQPIVTEIVPFNKEVIREAILRELERGGQVFFVHNRVQTIDRVANMINNLIPEANVAVAHGQMRERDLEKVMIDFVQQKYQVLVATMIIENGLDMPNVNTIIINRADKFGLAQLYQLRGRVGRSHIRAYAYLLIPPVELLTDEALKRLRAIEEFTELGSGSQLAMRDLEIRGAGNLLGAEQSGFIDALGFDLYNKLLDEAIKELKKENQLLIEEEKPEVDTQVNVDFDAFIPDTYVANDSERVELYRRLIGTDSLQEIEEIKSELEDRFGKLPEPAQNLLNLVSLRLLGKKLSLKKINVNNDVMEAVFDESFFENGREQFQNKLGSIVANVSEKFEFFQNEGVGIRLSLAGPNNKIEYARNFLLSLFPKNKEQELILK